MRLSVFSVNCCHYEWTLSWKTDLFPPISFTKTIRRLFILRAYRQLTYLAFAAGKGQNEKKRFISFQGQLGLRNPQAVRKCNCFSPYCAKTPMKFSIKILTIYRTKYLMMNACIMSFEQVECWNLRWISNDFCWYCNQILNFGTPSFL